MVSDLSISCMGISFLISLLLPVVLMIILHKKYNGSLKVFFLGMISYFITTQIIQAPILKILLETNESTAKFFNNNVIIYSVFTSLIAALLQFGARFIYLKYIAKNKVTASDSISFAIGFGGFESIFIGSIVAFNALSYALLINSGNLETSLQTANVSTEQITQTLNYYVSTPWQTWTMIGLERIFLLLLQISLTLMVFYGVKYRKNLFFTLSILCQITVNFPAALYSMNAIKNIYLAEGLTAILSILVFILAVYLCKVELTSFKIIKEKNPTINTPKKAKNIKNK